MNKDKALELLRQALTEIPKLKKLDYDNQEYELWRDKILNVLEASFGRQSNEYERFSDARPSVWTWDRDFYLKELQMRETALLSIIQKYEILGIEAKGTALAEPLKAIEDYGGRIVGGDFELVVRGTPDMLPASINNVIKNLNSQGYKYALHRTSGRPDDTNWDKTYFASYAVSQGTEGRIGTISFQLIPNNGTLLKSPQPDTWNPSFVHFLNHLFAEFQRLGFVDFKKERPALAGQLPKAFISHGKESEAIAKLQQFLSALGIEPIIVESQPNLGKTINDKVDYYLGQADCVVILATGDDEIEGKLYPRQNVIHEIGLAQKTHADKIIYLLEENTEFPSNISSKVWERFNRENMEAAFLRIVIELRALGLLRAVKP